MESANSKAKHQQKRKFRFAELPTYWPLGIALALAGALAWFSIRGTMTFYAWHRSLTLAFVAGAFLSISGFLWGWRKPDPFALSSVKVLLRQARRFWLALLLIHLSLAATLHLVFWGLLWLVGPRIWLLLFVVLVQTVSLVGLLGFWLRKIPASLALCWNASAMSKDLAGGWRNEFMLATRHAETVRADLSKPEPEMLGIVRILENGSSKGLFVGREEWKRPQWLRACFARLRAATFVAGVAIPAILLVFIVLLGSLRFASFPPGFLTGQNVLKLAMQEQSSEKRLLDVDPAAESARAGGNDGAQPGDGEAKMDGAEDADSAQGDSAGQAGSLSEGAEQPSQEGAFATDESQPDPNFDNREVIEDDGSPEPASQETSQQAEEPKKEQGMPNPLNLPGLRPGDQAGDEAKKGVGAPRQGESTNGEAGEGAGQQAPAGSGEKAGKPGSAKSGAGSGKGEGESGEESQGDAANDSSGKSGSKAGPREVEYGGGGGPESGKPGPPSPPDPAIQELIKIELPPLEAGRIKRKALSEEAKQGRGKAQTVERQAAGGREGEVVGKSESEQTLPNWILLMLQQKPKKER